MFSAFPISLKSCHYERLKRLIVCFGARQRRPKIIQGRNPMALVMVLI